MAGRRLGEALGEGDLVCCDVGGTSTDVSLVVEGAPFVENTFELEHDLVINALSTEISSVGAGGGSIVSISASGDVVVGPASAGSDPGPACYGRGGTQPTVTDAALLMGILDPDGFAGGALALDGELALRAFESLETPLPLEQRVGFAFRIAAANIAEEVTNVVLRRGGDPRDFTLIAYGAAGPMLLPAALDLMHVRRVVVPPHPGNFSALGLLSTDFVHYDVRSAYVPLFPESAAQIESVFEEMEQRLRERAGKDGEVRRSFDGRLFGQSWETPFVQVPDGPIDVGDLVERFHETYERRYGNRFSAIPVQGVSYRVELRVPSEKVEFARLGSENAGESRIEGRPIELRYLAEEPIEATEHERASLTAGARLAGPAVVREGLATTLVVPGQTLEVGALGELVIEVAG
jgi:N-methylhydantoinase A